MACVEAGSILKASNKLDVQQAGLSKIIQRLEVDWGQKLLYRDTRGVKPTPAGEALYQSLRSVLQNWQTVFQNQMDGQGQVLKIGCHSAVASSYFPQVLPRLLEQYPHLSVHSRFATSLEVTRQVSQLELDIGLVINHVKNADLVARTVSEDGLAVWKKAGSKKVLCYNSQMLGGTKHLKKIKDMRFLPLDDYEVIASLVGESGFFGILPRSLALRHHFHQVGLQLYSARLSVIYHKDSGPRTKEWAQNIVNCIGENQK